MKRQILPLTEIERNKRVRELMLNRIPKGNNPSLHLTSQEFDEMKGLMKEGYTREEAVSIVKTTNKLIDKLK